MFDSFGWGELRITPASSFGETAILKRSDYLASSFFEIAHLDYWAFSF
jgi:hypothetical protein